MIYGLPSAEFPSSVALWLTDVHLQRMDAPMLIFPQLHLAYPTAVGAEHELRLTYSTALVPSVYIFTTNCLTNAAADIANRFFVEPRRLIVITSGEMSLVHDV